MLKIHPSNACLPNGNPDIFAETAMLIVCNLERRNNAHISLSLCVSLRFVPYPRVSPSGATRKRTSLALASRFEGGVSASK